MIAIDTYRKLGDNFPNLLARSTYLGKYCRDGEVWADTVLRVAESNCALDPSVTDEEKAKLYHAIWSGWALPPGRGLWTGGVPGMPVEARYNCWGGVLRSIDDWCWLADMLMCGGGVGLSLLEISNLDNVSVAGGRLNILCSKSHPNHGEVMPDDPSVVAERHVIEDTREGWVNALRLTLTHAWAGTPLLLNLSSIRPRGAPIRTFGGIACGPGPLAQLCREVWAVVRGASGRKLNSVECLDITNHIGVCIKSGNVRRSALIVLGKADDQSFRNAKKDWSSVQSHRHSSNNSIVFEDEWQLDQFDWRSLVEDNAEFGEPGILNLWKIRQTDPLAVSINPCGEVPLHNREACNLAEIFPALIPPQAKIVETLKLITRYSLRQRLEPIKDPIAEAARVNNMRIGVGLGGVCDFDCDEYQLELWRDHVRAEATSYSKSLGVALPIATTTVKPSGTISLLNGSSPGIHAPFAPYYIRRTRISKQEPMAQALMEAGVPSEQCVYDSTGNTLVFSFPMAATNPVNTVQNESVKTQVERQVMLQKYWADNAVSTTISFRDDEKDELVALLQKHAKDMKSISCLPKSHGYEQPPYEEITAAQFHEMNSKINNAHPLTVGGDLEIEECSTGACPVR